MKNTCVTFKCAPNPGSKVKMPSPEIWSLCEPKIVWFLEMWSGLLTSEADSGGKSIDLHAQEKLREPVGVTEK